MSENDTLETLEGTPEQLLLEQAEVAAREFATYTQEQVDKITAAVATAAAEKAEFYAEWAVRDTTYGVIEHKVLKNQATSVGMLANYQGQNFNGYEIDEEKKLVKMAVPAGVILALTPCTNPIATINFKTMLGLLSRNVVVFCPHPAAAACSLHAVVYLNKVAEEAGAPKNTIQIISKPSIPIVGAMMKSDKVKLILATGGPAMVRAAYSSGNPALGVGPGNPPHYVDATTDLAKAAGDIILSACFDNNLLCTSESVVIAQNSIADELLGQMQAQGSFVVKGDDVEKLRSYLAGDGPMNPDAIGKTAPYLAEKAGIAGAEQAALLLVEVDEIDYNDIFCREKVFPINGYIRVDGIEQALEAAGEMIEFGGKGHSAAIHSEDSEAIIAWSSLNVSRIAVNGPATMVSAGLQSGLDPAATIGTGFVGRSSIAENVSPRHLINWRTIAYHEAAGMGDIAAAMQKWDAQREK